ncbi:MAG: hypothetical protein KGL35_10795 [Bradyrhizobium sp.]|nr:hypothetical protein [Bradyrhizobium sp.]
MIALATLRVRLEILQRNPQLLLRGLKAMADDRKPPITIKRPMELAGLKHRMTRAINQEKAIENVGKRYDVVQDNIDTLIRAHQDHAGALELYEHDLRSKIEGMLGNGDEAQSGETIRVSSDQVGNVGQVIEGTKEG